MDDALQYEMSENYPLYGMLKIVLHVHFNSWSYSHKLTRQQVEQKDDSRAPAIAKKQTRVAKPIRLRFFSVDLDRYTSPNFVDSLYSGEG